MEMRDRDTGALRLLLCSAIIAILVGITWGLTHVFASGVSEPTLYEGNPHCDDLGLLTFTSYEGTGQEEQPFGWVSSTAIDAVIVKGGPVANVYFYDEATEGTGLHTPVNPNNGTYYGISHIDWCYDKDEDEPTVTPSPTDTPTYTPTEEPTDTPTSTEVATDTPTATATETVTDEPPTNTVTETATPTRTEAATETPPASSTSAPPETDTPAPTSTEPVSTRPTATVTSELVPPTVVQPPDTGYLDGIDNPVIVVVIMVVLYVIGLSCLAFALFYKRGD